MPSSDAFPGKHFFDEVYRGPAPWDIGAAQPDLLALIEEFPPRGRLLDLGCGTGDLAIALAQRGHPVIGIDFAEAAIEIARSRLSSLPADRRSRIEFRLGDALHPSHLAGEVESVTDSGFFHLFDAAARSDLAEELASVLPMDGRYYMLGFAISIPAPDVPRQVTEDEIVRLFSQDAGWVIRKLTSARFVTRGLGPVPAVALCAERVEGPREGAVDLDAFRQDIVSGLERLSGSGILQQSADTLSAGPCG